jgi:hypothetical protein
VTVASCSCGFAELADETLADHLQRVFIPDDGRAADGTVHEEHATGTCACGFGPASPIALDAHLLAVFTPGNLTGCDGREHQPAGGW